MWIYNPQLNIAIESDNSEFDSEEVGNDEDLSQETEEELLDIPTFLRRQAN